MGLLELIKHQIFTKLIQTTYFIHVDKVVQLRVVMHVIFQGNEDLKPETSWNKEIGVEYNKDGYLASLTYFRNDYRNKIVPSDKTYWCDF